MKLNRFAAIAATAVLTFSIPTFAVVTSTGSRATLTAPLGTSTDVDFTGVANVSYTAAQVFAGVDFGPFSVRSPVLSGFDGDVAINGEALTLFPDNVFGGAPSLLLEFDSPITAFGADFVGVNSTGLPVEINGMSANTLDVFMGGTSGFAGFTSDTPFTTLQFGPAFDSFTIDNLVFGNGVPEPVTLSALAMTGLLLRRRR